MTVFVDTNVLVYARDPGSAVKHERADRWLRQVWARRLAVTSVQVLNEFYVTVRRKLRVPMDAADARDDVRRLLAWDPVVITPAMQELAWTVEDRYGFSWWDSLVVAAAQLVDAEFLLTEDLQDGQDLGGVTVVDPFRHDPDDILGRTAR